MIPKAKFSKIKFRTNIKVNKNNLLNTKKSKYINSLSKNSFAKKLHSFKNLNKEIALIRFKDKSVYNISSSRKKYESLLNIKLIEEIAKKKKISLKDTIFIHQHPNSEFERYHNESFRDLVTFSNLFFEQHISKYEVSFMDKDNIKEIGRIHIHINPEKIKEFKEKGYLDLCDYILKLQNLSKEQLIKNKIEMSTEEIEDGMLRTWIKLESCFIKRFVGLNNYRYNPKLERFELKK